MTPTIAFDAFWWTKGPAAVRHVMREIVLEWRRANPDHRLILICRRGDGPTALHDLGGANVEVRETRLWPHGLAVSFMGRQLARTCPDLSAVITHNFAAPSRKSVVYLHDLLFIDHPNWFSRRERIYFWFMRPLANRARLVLTSSRSEARRIEQHCGRPAHAIGIGISRELLDVTPIEPPGALLPGRFLLTVGRLNIRKNLRSTIDGAISSQRLSHAFPLVVVGESDGAQEQLSRNAQQAVEKGHVRFLGRVSDAELAWLYTNTAGTIMMSRGEGFGMPPLESLAFGAPVLVSDIPVFRETVGSSATFASPDSIESISLGVQTLLRGSDSEQVRRQRMEAGRASDWTTVVSQMRRIMIAEGLDV